MSKYISIEELYGFYLNAKQQICTDTRKLEAGSVFFALKGGNFNANEFAQKAINAGCSIAVVDEEKYVTDAKIVLVEDVFNCFLEEVSSLERVIYHIIANTTTVNITKVIMNLFLLV